jgi:HlyD family secretion protein
MNPFCKFLFPWCGGREARPALRHYVPALALGACVLAAGCHKAPPGKPIEVEPPVHLVKPQRRDLHYQVGQPGWVYAYEQTSLYPKITGYVEKWYVDIGAPLEKGQLMADLYVPELHARYREKKELVKRAKEQVQVDERLVDVAEGNVQVAAADIVQARAEVKKYQADVERWESEVQRLSNLTQIVDKQVLVESQKQLKVYRASVTAAEAAVQSAQAREVARKADLEKAKADVAAAKVQVGVDQAADEDLAALVSYTHLHAPYDGVVILRNVNEGDYVEPRYGDASVPRAGYTTQIATQGVPLYVVARTDIVRVYVDVPEMEANYVHGPTKEGPGTKAHVRIQAVNDMDVEATVKRTSWALDYRSRTLRAEIDLPNKDRRIRPGMYAYGEVEIDCKDALTLPADAVIEIGNEQCCYLYEDGKAVRTPVQTGLNSRQYIQVFKKKVKDRWEAFTGNEEVILGELAELRNGEKVRVEHGKAKEGEGAAEKGDKEKR